MVSDHIPAMNPRPDERFSASALLAVAGLAALATGVVAVDALGPRPDATVVAAVFSPTLDLAEIARRLDSFDGRIVRMGGLPNIAIVAAARPDLAGALYRAGAWLVLDPRAGGCWDWASVASPRAALGSARVSSSGDNS